MSFQLKGLPRKSLQICLDNDELPCGHVLFASLDYKDVSFLLINSRETTFFQRKKTNSNM